MANKKVIERPANQKTITKRYTEKAVEFITKNKNSPFFLYLAHSMPQFRYMYLRSLKVKVKGDYIQMLLRKLTGVLVRS